MRREAPELVRYRPREVIRQFAHSFAPRAGFLRRGRHAERIAALFVGSPEIVIARASTGNGPGERLNVQDFIEGIPACQAGALPDGFDPPPAGPGAWRRCGAAGCWEAGFPRRPAPGQRVLPAGQPRIAFIGFRMVGRLSGGAPLRGGDADARPGGPATPARWPTCCSTGAPTPTATPNPCAARSRLSVDDYHGVALKKLDLGALLADVVAILREHGLALPPDLAPMIKAFIALEAWAASSTRIFDIAGEVAPLPARGAAGHLGAGDRPIWRNTRQSVQMLAGPAPGPRPPAPGGPARQAAAGGGRRPSSPSAISSTGPPSRP